MTLSVAAPNAQIDALIELLTDGQLIIYSGSRPADADGPVGDAKVLVVLPLKGFMRTETGKLVAEHIPAAIALETGTATWFRCWKDTMPILDGSVGESDADLLLNTVRIGQDSEVTIGRFTYTIQSLGD